MKKFLLNLQFIFRPSFWIMTAPFDRDIDEIMNHLLDKYEFSNIGKFIAFLGAVEIWIGNQPYSCMVPYKFIHKYRPSRLTILKGIHKLNEKIKEEELAEINNFKKKHNMLNNI